MAIIYTKELSEDIILMSFNNNILRFHSDNTIQALSCEVTIGGLNQILLYPTPDGKFMLNVKDYINSIIDSKNFIDDLQIVALSTYIYDWTARTLSNLAITLKINFVDTTSESDTIYPTFLSSYSQLFELNDKFNDKRIYLLHNCENINGQEIMPVFLKWFVGYPFDFTFYNNTNSVTIKDSLADLPAFTKATKQVNRCVVSNGFDTSEISVLFDNKIIKLESSDETISYIKAVKEVVSCYDNKYYLKWINRFGGWNYWLFEDSKVVRNTKDLGEINNNFNNIEDTTSKNYQIGKESQDKISLTTNIIDIEEQRHLSDLLDSVKVMLFRGIPNNRNYSEDWIEVALSQGNYPIKNAKQQLTQWSLTIELPTRDTRTI
jgi:hypothetical protein